MVYFISAAGEWDGLWSVSVTGGRPELLLENVSRAAIDREGKRFALLRADSSPQWTTLWWSSPLRAEPTKETRPPFDFLRSSGAQLDFSPDGQLLVWMYGVSADIQASAPAENSSDFYLIPADGGEPRKVLTGLPPPTTLAPFDWLPDSRHVMLALPDPRLGSRHLWVADTRSNAHWQVTATHTNETEPAVSFLGGRVAYASEEVDFDLVLIFPDGLSRRPLLATARNEFDPTWSPSGDQFAFVTDRSGSLEIWARSSDGKFERPIVSATDFGASPTQTLGSLAFSPDGRTLAYQRSSDGGFHIWLSPATGGAPVRLNSAQGSRLYQDMPAWSPDGEWIAYSQTEAGLGRRQALRKHRVGTSESVPLIENRASFGQTEWTSDGKWIVCQTDEGLARIAADGGTLTVNANATLQTFTLARDGRRLYALADSETFGHFALIEVDIMERRCQDDQPGPRPDPRGQSTDSRLLVLEGTRVPHLAGQRALGRLVARGISAAA